MLHNKRVLSLLLAVVMLLGVIPFGGFENVANAEEIVDERPLTLRPREVNLGDEWTQGADKNDRINQASVELKDRFRGSVINPLSSDEAKVQVLSLMNSKSESRSSVGAEGFKTYAFDNWQYVDSMIFWDGKVPTPDVIDAAHRNGVPIYGTLFFNWSSSFEDQKVLLNFLREDSEGSGTFPEARKHVDMAKYYGFDGYFINQETSGQQVGGKGETMREFMLYAKKYAESIGYPIRFSWYDAMANDGYRSHQDAVNKYNDYFVKADEDGTIPGDEFFINFNWNKQKNQGTAEYMNSIGRNQYDAYAGFELQQNSINTYINWDSLIGEDKKAIVSIGLFTPDSILGFSKDGEDYHVQERNFWTGYEGDPSISKDREGWRGISRFVSDSSPITSLPFKTFFNTGHGKLWFENGELSREYEWNARGVSEVLPTWRWWIQTSGTRLEAKYDYEDAYYGGNSIKFYGTLDSENQINLYSTKLDATSSTKLRLTTKGGQNSTIAVGVTTDEAYSNDSFVYTNIEPSEDWNTTVVDLSQFAGQTIRAINVKIDGSQSDYSFNIGELSVYNSDEKVASPENAKVSEHLLFDAKNSEAIIEFDRVDGADYYVVYADNGKEYEFIQASSSNIMYLPNIRRTDESEGTVQKLRIVAVGLNGTISEPKELDLDWKMEVIDTGSGIVVDPENVVLGATVLDKSGEESGEKAENALSGTITGNSDKWTVAGARSGWMSIRLTEERTIRRWRVEHAGHGGESVNDGKMNTKNFALEYRKDENSPWEEVKVIKNNIDHVTDVNLDEPVTGTDFRLRIDTADNGSPWGAIRIYNWMMFEEEADLTTSKVVPISQVSVENVEDNKYNIILRNVDANTKVELLKDRDGNNLIAEQSITEKGHVVFTLQELEGKSGLLYYRTTAEGMDPSNILAVPYDENIKVEKPETPQEPEDPEVDDNEEIPVVKNPFGDTKARIVSVDAGRKYFSVEQIKEIIDKLSDANYTHLHLLLGNDGLRFLLDDMQIETSTATYSSDDVKNGITKGNLVYGESKGVTENIDSSLSESEMDEILEYANSKNIEVIPAINSPGHMDAILVLMEELGIEDPYAYNGNRKSHTTLNIEREDVVEFTQEFIQLYIDYFESKGVKSFNFGADEYANDAYQNPGWAQLIRQGKYDKFVDFANVMAERILKANMRPIAFNDGFYYGSNTDAEFNSQIIIALWTAGWNGFNVASANTFIKKGHDVLNVNDAWYYVLGRETQDDGGYSRQNALKGMENKAFDVNVGNKINTIGSMIALWSDEPSKTFEIDKFDEWINTFAKNNPDEFGLKETVNKEALENQLNTIESLLESIIDDLTDETLEQIDNSINNAIDILEREDATQEEVDNAYQELTDLMSNLGLNPSQPTDVDKDILVKTIEEIEAMLTMTADSLTQDSLDQINEVLYKAMDVLDREDATQEEVDQIAMELIEVYSQAEFMPEEFEEVDKTQYINAINLLQELFEDMKAKFTEESGQAFEEQLAIAKQLLEKEDVTKEELSNIVEATKEAFKQLETKQIVDTTSLESLIRVGELKLRENITEESSEKLADVIREVSQLLGKTDLTNDELSEGILKLVDAIANAKLVEEIEEPEDAEKPEEPEDLEKPEDAEKPEEPEDLEKPEDPKEPDKPVDSEDLEEPEDTETPDTPTQPGETQDVDVKEEWIENDYLDGKEIVEQTLNEKPTIESENESAQSAQKPSTTVKTDKTDKTVVNSGNSAKNPQTSDPGIALYGMITLMASGAYVFTKKKIK